MGSWGVHEAKSLRDMDLIRDKAQKHEVQLAELADLFAFDRRHRTMTLGAKSFMSRGLFQAKWISIEATYDPWGGKPWSRIRHHFGLVSVLIMVIIPLQLISAQLYDLSNASEDRRTISKAIFVTLHSDFYNQQPKMKNKLRELTFP